MLISLIRALKHFELEGVLDSGLAPGTEVSGVGVLGKDDLLHELYASGIKQACIAVGSIKDNSKRMELYGKVKQSGYTVPPLIHPGAIVSAEHNKLSEGVQIMAGAIIQPDSFIGENTIINTGAIIEHDCVIGRHVHICPGAVISGKCSVGDGSFIGAGATVIHGIKIGKRSIVAAGAVVINDVQDDTTVMGVPAK